MLRLAACLAAADAGERDFYRSVISKVAVPKTEEGSDLRGWPSVLDGPASSDFWRLALLLLLAKAEVVVWPKVLSLLRRMDPQVASSVPSAQLPRLLRHLHLAALENDVILLEGRPVAKELMKAVHVDEWTPEELAAAASALGYLAVVDVNVAEAGEADSFVGLCLLPRPFDGSSRRARRQRRSRRGQVRCTLM